VLAGDIAAAVAMLEDGSLMKEVAKSAGALK
jgi:hypothetical protein